MDYKMLIAEDEVIELDYLTNLVKNKIPQIEKVFTAATGQEAVDVFLREECDIVLIDINMPVKNEYNFNSSVSSLIDHSKKIKSLLEPEMVFAIINRADEFSIQRYFQTFSIAQFDSTICLLLEKAETREAVQKMKAACQDSGYLCITAEVPRYYICYIFSTFPI